MKMKLLTTIGILLCLSVGTLGIHTYFATEDNAYKDFTTGDIDITLIELSESETRELENTCRDSKESIDVVTCSTQFVNNDCKVLETASK